MTRGVQYDPLHLDHHHHVCHDRYEYHDDRSLQLPLRKVVPEQLPLPCLPLGVIGQSSHRRLFSSHSILLRETLPQESVLSWRQTFSLSLVVEGISNNFLWIS